MVSTGPGILWAIDRATFRSTLNSTTQSTLATYNELLVKAKQIPILARLTNDERRAVVEAIEEQSKSAGTVLMRQGEAKPKDGAGFFMYFLIEVSVSGALLCRVVSCCVSHVTCVVRCWQSQGKCQCTKLAADGKTVEVDFEYGPGSYFGEL